MVRKKVISFILLFFALACNFTNSVKKYPVRKSSVRQRKFHPVNRKLLFKRIRSKKQNYFDCDGRKFLLGSILTLSFLDLGAGSVIYLCSDDKKAPVRLPENDDNIKITNEIKMCTVDEKFIKNNFFLCGWENNSCWNDVFVQFLMLPPIRCQKYGSDKINKTIKWINTELSKKYDGNLLNRKVYIPIEYRPISDERENWLKDGDYHTLFDLFHGTFDGQGWAKLGLTSLFHIYNPDSNSYYYSSFVGNLDNAFNTLSKQQTCRDSYLAYFGNISTFSNPNTPESALKDVQGSLFECHSGYYPTFIVVGNGNHYCSCVIIYDVNSEVKFILWMDGTKKGMQIISKQQILQRLSNLSNRSEVYIVFSRDSIVRQYYTPC